jgi:four helix bundle protein
LNIQHPTSNIQRSVIGSQKWKGKYDLEQRLLEYASKIIHLVEDLPNTRTGNHIATQLLRSGTSPLPNHGEAQAAESPADFIHKLKVCLKELRESYRWILLIQRASLLKSCGQIQPLLDETQELIRIFVASIRTSEKKRSERVAKTETQ